MKEQLTSLFEYGTQANQRLLEVVAPLTAEQFSQKISSSFGSVHLTLIHILGAEMLWFALWQGRSPAYFPSEQDLPDVPALQARWAAFIAERRAYFAAVEESDLSTTVSWTQPSGQTFALPRWQIMFHCANHSTHHHSELAAMLTELGLEHDPNITNLLSFYLERARTQ